MRISRRNQCFRYLIFYGRFLFFLFCIYFRSQKPFNCIFERTLFLSSLFFSFSFKFLDFIMKKTMIFVYISSNRIQHEFFIYFFDYSVMKPSKTIVFFDIPKMSFCLNKMNLSVQNPLFTLYVCMGFFFQSFPLFIDLHDFIFLDIFFNIIFIETFCFMFTTATFGTSIHLKRLCVTNLFLGFCSDIVKFSSIMTDIIKFILEHLRFHVVIFSNIFFISLCFSFFMIL